MPIRLLKTLSAFFCLGALFGSKHEANAQCVAPSITRQPLDRSITTGSGASFSLGVTASGTSPLSYQWHRNNSPIPNATNRAYVMSPAQPSDAGVYFVTVSNCSGVVAISSNAVVSVSNPPYVLMGLTNHFWR